MIKARSARKDSWRNKRFNSACEKAAKIMEERYVHIPSGLTHREHLVVTNHNHARARVRLFNLGDKLAGAERKRRLKGQFRRMSKLRDLIFWTDVGEVGFTDYQKRLKRKQIAVRMSTDLHDDVSPEKTLQMISKAIEAQEKHDKATGQTTRNATMAITTTGLASSATCRDARAKRTAPSISRRVDHPPVRLRASPRGNRRRNTAAADSGNRGQASCPRPKDVNWI